MNNNLKCLILGYITDNNILQKITNTSILTLLQKCTTTLKNISIVNDNLLTFYNLHTIDSSLAIHTICQLIQIASLPKLQHVYLLIKMFNYLSLIDHALIFFEQYFTGNYIDCNNDTKVVKHLNRNIKNKSIFLANENNWVQVNDDVLIVKNNPTKLWRLFAKHKTLFGIEINEQVRNINDLVDVPELYKLKLNNKNWVINDVITLLNGPKSRISIITNDKNYDSKISANGVILTKATSNYVQIIDIDIIIDMVDEVMIRFPNVKQIRLFTTDSDIELVIDMLIKYVKLKLVIVSNDKNQNLVLRLRGVDRVIID